MNLVRFTFSDDGNLWVEFWVAIRRACCLLYKEDGVGGYVNRIVIYCLSTITMECHINVVQTCNQTCEVIHEGERSWRRASARAAICKTAKIIAVGIAFSTIHIAHAT